MPTKTSIVNDYEQTETILERSIGGRGLGHIKFDDRYGQTCSLQDSSLATEAAIWFGVDNTGPQMGNENVKSRMHLTQSMVKQLLPFLITFAETGEYIANIKDSE